MLNGHHRPRCPPIPQGEARIWFYRDAGPYDSQAQPYILMNGATVAVSLPRSAFYLDVKPGFYHVTVQQYLSAPEEAANINLTPGQQVYLKIVSLTDCIAGGGGSPRSPGYFTTVLLCLEHAGPGRAGGDGAHTILRRQLIAHAASAG